MKRAVEDIEDEMRELYLKKEIAYLDYSENMGNTSGLRERLWEEFKQYRNLWNDLVEERKRILGIT